MFVHTKVVLDELDQQYTSANKKAEWINTSLAENNIALEPITYEDNMMPDVKGMGARDALYLLENMNLKVKLTGSGKVTEQSIAPGTKIVKGSFVSIHLN